MEKAVTVSKDGIAKSYSDGRVTTHPRATISRVKPSDFPRIDVARPPYLIFRSLNVGLFDPKDYVVTSDCGEIEGRRHVVLQEHNKSAAWSLWVDPARDFVVSRFVLSQDGNLLADGNISYARSNEDGWVPKQWTIVHKDQNGTIKRSITAVVKELAINVPINPHEFELDFPPGTYVADSTRKTDGGETFQYEVLEDGQTRVVKPGEQ